ncbi:transglutaminase domain-containing protein [Butyrivibrio sp. YAB3001]|uniref:transglutaminase domain-containing protein n=1 Tax=Butyrivibrio sp. YAB3001 TaxID=1520812 RepID=UPI0008F64FAA|nr:transglutaminase domain-containing protein [Butyrivibrio sp. YAB3001]SFC92523.1 Transglutaminase-like superfamily protein [Butyrivibrio sp. YAB3001]
MRVCFAKKKIAILLSILTMICMLSGCAYSSVDEYLEILGMKDASTEDNTLAENGIGQDISGTEPSDSNNSSAADEDSGTNSTDATSSGVTSDEQTSDESIADKLFSDSYMHISESSLNEDMKQARLDAGLTDNSIDLVKREQKGLYAYERLTEAGKTLYAEMLIIIQNMAVDVPVSTTSDEALDLVFDYLLIDHPELFYVDGYKYTNYLSLDDVITNITFSGSYIYNENEVAIKQKQIDKAANECLSGAPGSSDEYYAIKYIYEYLINNTEYDVEAEDNQNICSVFINKKSVCNGYSKAAQYLLNKLGINCTLVTGTVDTKKSKGVSHAWNLVECNGAYYYLDVTWGDSSYQVGNGESADATRLPAVNYDYLNVTTDELLKNHTISDVIYMPVCNSLKDNYYVREDEYFTSAELALVGELFSRRYQDGSSNVIIKCASKNVYDQLFDQLITQRLVFNYLQGENSSISYTTFADTNTIIFWIA